jgi:type I restriction enzyme S subunit
MKFKWPLVRLGEILRRVERFEMRDEATEYPFAGTYSFARGIFVGERKAGSTFALPKIQRIKAGDFVYCKIMAWEGAFGLVPPAANGCVMSGAFVVYEPVATKIDPEFLNWYFKVPAHWEAVGRESTGTNVRRKSLHPSDFEAFEIPLPPINEQQRIVARIDALVAELDEARAFELDPENETGS